MSCMSGLCYREQQILQKWHELMELLEKKKRTLTGFSELLGMFREMESIQVEMKEMEVGGGCNILANNKYFYYYYFIIYNLYY